MSTRRTLYLPALDVADQPQPDAAARDPEPDAWGMLSARPPLGCRAMFTPS
jgi:hypothetical protein